MPDWYFDPANRTGCASNSNSCTTQTCGTTGVGPCVTMNEVIYHRWGTIEPVLPQATTFHLMSSETLGQESIFLEPYAVGTGPSNFNIDGTLGMIQVGSSFHAASVTPRARGGPGQLLTLSGMPAGATVGAMVENTTNESYAFIDALAAGVATMTQPLDASPIIANNQNSAVEVNWTSTGDTLKIWTLPMLNLKHFAPVGGDANAGGVIFPSSLLLNFWVPDISGTVGYSTLNFVPVGVGLIAINLHIDPFLNFMGSGQDVNASAYNCWIPGGTQGQFCGFTSGALCTGNVLGVGNGLGFTRLEDIASLDGDIIVHGETLIKGGSYDIISTMYVADATSSNGLGVIHGGVLMLEQSQTSDTTCQVWGPGKLFLESPLSAVENLSGTTWASILTLSGGYTIDSVTTGSKYAAGVWTDGINITPANLDTNNGLQNPRTGSRFSTN